MESWNEVMASAKGKMSLCRACKNCNGIVCAGETPGCGGKGSGSSFMRNYNK
ncbi:MAG TPA: alpha-hydroxy-acid oxidizing enzyme, partial [Dielma fastidiosa]|nr:alpha-hydroxy-acid oxidizing enzyme [Dielma fastidiosa]